MQFIEGKVSSRDSETDLAVSPDVRVQTNIDRVTDCVC